MSDWYQLQFATYLFPNKTFKLADHRVDIDTPAAAIRRSDISNIQDGFLQPKRWKINGKIFGTDQGTVHNDLDTLKRSLHNAGVGASFFYRGDRYAFAHLAPGGVYAAPLDAGLYGFAYDLDIVLVSDPFVESITRQTVSGSRTNNSFVENVSVEGSFPPSPVFTFVGGTWNFGGNIRVENAANSLYFQYGGGLTAGATLIVDCALGCVLLQNGTAFVDRLSYLSGHLTTFVLEAGGVNDIMISAPTLLFTMDYRDRWYI